MAEFVRDRYPFVFVVVLVAVGLYGMLVPTNLVKKVIGLAIFQTAIYLFFVEGSVKEGASAPVIDPAIGSDPDRYVNPLPHLLVLTAIVVGVGVLGVAFALMNRLHEAYGSLDEETIIERIAERDRAADSSAAPAEGGGET
jgi:multicomponent Na+:H+ antiporter subunit C